MSITKNSPKIMILLHSLATKALLDGAVTVDLEDTVIVPPPFGRVAPVAG